MKKETYSVSLSFFWLYHYYEIEEMAVQGDVTVKSNKYTVQPMYQWDKNQVLTIYGLSLDSAPEIHFTNTDMSRAIVKQASMDNAGVVTVEVPNSLLQKSYPITAYVCDHDGDKFNTLYTIEIPVKARKKPADYVLVDDKEVYSFNALENDISDLARLIEAHNTVDDMFIQKFETLDKELRNDYTTTDAELNDKYATLSRRVVEDLNAFSTDLGYLKTYVTPQMFGAKGDGVTDDSAAIISAATHCTGNDYLLLFPPARYAVSESIDLRYINVDCQGTIVIKHSGIGVIVGDSSNRVVKRKIKISNIEHSEYNEGDISVRIVGLMNGDVNIGRANYVQLYADGDSEYSSIAYSNFHIGKCDYLQLCDKEGTASTGWINENTFYDCRVMTRFSIEGSTYAHNNNVFYKPCFENAKVILSNCTRNKFYDVRNEGSFSMTLDKNTSSNLIDYNYFYTFPYVANNILGITDKGINNIVTNSSFSDLHSVPVYSLNAYTVNKNLYEIGNAKTYLTVNDDVVTIAKEWATIIDNAVIPVKGISFLRFNSDAGAFRFSFTPLDVDKNIMKNNPLTQDGNGNGANAEGVYNIPTDSWGANIAIVNPDVAYIKLTVSTGSSLSKFSFTNLSAVAYYHPYDFRRATMLIDCLKTAIPTV